MSNHSNSLTSRIDALKQDPTDSEANRLVRGVLRSGRAVIGGELIKFAQLSNAQKCVVVTCLEEFLHYGGHGVKYAPFMERHDNARQVAESKLSSQCSYGPVGGKHYLTSETIEEGLDAFSQMIIEQARRHAPKCFMEGGTQNWLRRMARKNHPAGAREGRKGARPSLARTAR